MQRELSVIAGSPDQFEKAIVRKAGAGIFCDRMDNVRLAALDENLGDDFADLLALRDGVKVALALGARVCHQIGLVKGA